MKKLRPRKSLFKEILYPLESILGLILTIIMFVAICKKSNYSELRIIIVGLVCAILDIVSIYNAFKMAKKTKERQKLLDRNPSLVTGKSKSILEIEKEKKIANSLKLTIETVFLIITLL